VGETIRLVLESLFFPLAIGLVIWAVTQRNSDRAAIEKTLAEAGKTQTESELTEETFEAAVQLADIKTLQESITTMGAAFREERESLERRLEVATLTAKTALVRQNELAHEVDTMRGDVQRYHREVLDMYRRDQYHARALQLLTDWIEDNLPRLLEIRPDLPDPPLSEPLPPLHIPPTEDVPSRRWYDREPSLDTDDQEL
jgi:type I site-specific restriction endonuclease